MTNDLTTCMGEQIFCDKFFLFVCRQWLLDSGTANALGEKAGKMQKVIEKGY